jgi:hypothetical protein
MKARDRGAALKPERIGINFSEGNARLMERLPHISRIELESASASLVSGSSFDSFGFTNWKKAITVAPLTTTSFFLGEPDNEVVSSKPTTAEAKMPPTALISSNSILKIGGIPHCGEACTLLDIRHFARFPW